MVVSYPAPALCQGSDEDVLLQVGEVVFPGFVKRPEKGNGLSLWVAGERTRALAVEQFHTLLGALRVVRTDAGELAEESGAAVWAKARSEMATSLSLPGRF